MAPIQLEHLVRWDLVAITGAHIIAALVLSGEVGRSLHRSYRALGPSQETRERRATRSKLIPIFASLALVSLVSSAYGALSHATLSYKVWATRNEIIIPSRFYGNQGIFPRDENATGVHITRWLSDTIMQSDTISIVADKARRFWWAQQLDVGLLSFTAFLTIEGRRRNIPLLWCYQLLAQLVSLSYAENLFFVALLLTPSPIPRRDESLPVSRYVRARDALFPPKPVGWELHPALHALLYVPQIFSLLLLGLQGADGFAAQRAALVYRASTLLPLIASSAVPASWGQTSRSSHEAYQIYRRLFTGISIVSALLHAKSTLVGLAYNVPGLYLHRERYGVHIPFDLEKRSSWDRSITAFSRILEARSEHPVVSTIGRDVLLSTISLGAWAAVRSTDVSDIVSSCLPFVGASSEDASKNLTGASELRRGSHKRAAASIESIASDTDGDRRSGTLRKRGRPKRAITKDPAEDSDDQTYEPTPSEVANVAEGDILPEQGETGWESTALVWGLTALGGLGVSTAAALGAECIAR